MAHRQRKTARHRGLNDSAAHAAQCARKLDDFAFGTRRSCPSLKTLCRIADAFGRHLEIVFHEHEHVHADGTRHVHPHSHYDPEHQHDHGGEK